MSHHPRRRTRPVGTTAVLLLAPLVLVASVPVAGVGDRVGGLRVSLPEPARDAGAGSPLLVPGASMPLDLTVANPYAVAVQVTGLRVRVGAVRPPATVGCRAADFVASDAAFGRIGLPARGSTSLSAAGVPPSQWPRVSMPAAAAEVEGCRGLEVTLDFSATGRFV